MLSLKPLTDISLWARSNGLEIVLLVTGAMLLTRLATWLGGKITRRIDAAAHEADSVVRSEASKHRHALAQVFTWAALVIIYCATAAAVAVRIGIPITGLVAPAAATAVALGFGAQRIVQDILAGFFIIAERQYGFGDLIRLTAPNVSQPATGTVEDVTLRVTAIRTADGELVITPNGQITQVTNLSRDWARAVVDVPVPAAMDVNQVSDTLKKIGDAFGVKRQFAKYEDVLKDPETNLVVISTPNYMHYRMVMDAIARVTADAVIAPEGRPYAI